MAEIKSFPNNQDVYVGAEWVMKWLHGRTSGVFGADGNLSTAVVQNSLSVEVSDGVGWISNSNGDGIVFWNDAEQDENQKLTLTHDLADGVLDRIDRIVVSWETTNYVALPTIEILKGTPASTPVPPSLTNNNVLRQISLAKVSIPAGTVSLSPSMLTDERLDSEVCGIVTDSVSIDTSVMQNQFEVFLNAIQDELQSIEAGAGVELSKLHFADVLVSANGFTNTGTHAEYPYRVSVTLEGVTSTMLPDVAFGLADAEAGLFAPVAETYNGGIFLYAHEVPDSDVTIPNIICWRGNA